MRYAYDGETLLGTGGALRAALPLLGPRFLVMYGDSYLDGAFAPVYRAFLGRGLPALMTVLRNDGRWDASNVEFTGGVIAHYDKAARTPAMHHIDYGLGVLAASAIEAFPPGAAFDLATLYRDFARRGPACRLRG